MKYHVDTKDMTFHVTGVTTAGHRFKIVTSNSTHALGINLWRGSVWAVEKGGKRILIKRVMN